MSDARLLPMLLDKWIGHSMIRDTRTIAVDQDDDDLVQFNMKVSKQIWRS
jgi:hypothetical protein